MALVFAYLGGVCFPKEQDAKGNPRTFGLVAQNGSVIYRADGVSVGVKTAGGRRRAFGRSYVGPHKIS